MKFIEAEKGKHAQYLQHHVDPHFQHMFFAFFNHITYFPDSNTNEQIKKENAHDENERIQNQIVYECHICRAIVPQAHFSDFEIAHKHKREINDVGRNVFSERMRLVVRVVLARVGNEARANIE